MQTPCEFSFAWRTLIGETGYGGWCGRHGGRCPLGAWIPDVSLIGRPKRTLDCRPRERFSAARPEPVGESTVFLGRRAGRPVEGSARWRRCIDDARDWTCIRRRSWPVVGSRPAARFDRSWGGLRPRRRAFWRCRRGWPRPRRRTWRWRRRGSTGSRSGTCCATTSAWFSPTPRTFATYRAARATPTMRRGSPIFSPTV